jgi:methionyl aminopeptidase
VSIDTEEDVAALKQAGQVVKETLAALEQHVKVGVNTLELDGVAKRIFERYGARSAPTLVYGFPGTVLISVNDEVVHGIPGARQLRQGDIVKLDVTPELNGYVADAATTVVVAAGAKDEGRVRLARAAKQALEVAINVARAGTPLRTIGAVVEQTVRHAGFSVIPELCGHGVGRTIHEAPEVIPNYPEKRVRGVLKAGMVITIEPIIAAGTGERFTHCYTADDKWTIKTSDGSDAAHFEHTLLITKGAPVVLTA